MDHDTVYLTIAEAAELINQRHMSSLELTNAVLDRISETQPLTNAFITIMTDSARAEATAADNFPFDRSHRGPLHGIPMSVKDVYATKGIMTSWGTAALEDNVPDVDSAVVARLRQAGAIIVGKANLTECAERFPSPRWGVVHNPWDLKRCAGLSSSGSAAAVISGASFASIGNDTGGSIRVPASYTGCVGIKPTYGRCSRTGALPTWSSMDCVGPLTRTVADAATVLQVLAGYDSADPTSSTTPVPRYEEALGEGLSGIRIGIPKQYFFEQVDTEVTEHIHDAITALAGLGARIVEVSLPNLTLTNAARGPLQEAETFAAHEVLFRERGHLYGDDLAKRVQEGAKVSGSEYVRALALRDLILRELVEVLENVDVLVTPTTPRAAYVAGPGMPGYTENISRDPTSTPPSFAAPFSLTGLPAMSIPCGFTKTGLPIGLQIGGPPFGEPKILQVAHGYEHSTDWHTRRPPID